MANPIKKVEFSELYNTMTKVCAIIDGLFMQTKTGKKKGKKIYDGFSSYKEFLHHIETEAIKVSAKELDLGETTVRDRWKIMTLPLPVLDALEANEVSFSKLKPLTTINFDIENPKDVDLAQRLIDEIKKDISMDEIKALVKKESVNIWNSQTVLMEMFAKQNGITSTSVC